METEVVTERLINLRKKANKTQSEVAKAVGVSASCYSMYENGERIPSDAVKVKIAKYFNRTVGFIFYPT